nr:MAG TPA: hypothetical protein [Caudoviricetes sp.]DAU90942.1 MAG TPA: hypothetical protein [Caudoviricetes sp.]
MDLHPTLTFRHNILSLFAKGWAQRSYLYTSFASDKQQL